MIKINTKRTRPDQIIEDLPWEEDLPNDQPDINSTKFWETMRLDEKEQNMNKPFNNQQGQGYPPQQQGQGYPPQQQGQQPLPQGQQPLPQGQQPLPQGQQPLPQGQQGFDNQQNQFQGQIWGQVGGDEDKKIYDVETKTFYAIGKFASMKPTTTGGLSIGLLVDAVGQKGPYKKTEYFFLDKYPEEGTVAFLQNPAHANLEITLKVEHRLVKSQNKCYLGIKNAFLN